MFCPQRDCVSATAVMGARWWKWLWCGCVVLAIYCQWRSWRRWWLASHQPEARARRQSETARSRSRLVRRVAAAPPEGLKKKPLNPAVDTASPNSSVLPPSPSEVWPQILRSVGPMMGNFLEKAGLPAITGPNTLVLRFSADYNQAGSIVRSRPGSPRSKKPCEKVRVIPGFFGSKAVRHLRRRPPPRWRRRPRRGATIGPRRRKALVDGPWMLWAPKSSASRTVLARRRDEESQPCLRKSANSPA